MPKDVKQAAYRILGETQDALLDVGVMLQRATDDDIETVVAAMDLKLRDAYRAADACRRLLVLYRKPVHEGYDPVGALKEASAQCCVNNAKPGVVQARRVVTGDEEIVLECLRLISQNITIESGSMLRTEITTGEGTPRIVLRLEGEGVLPQDLTLDGYYDLDIDEFGQRWIAGTGGGNVAMSKDGFILYLEGDREVPASVTGDLNALRKTAGQIARRLTHWRGAIGQFEPGMVSTSEIAGLYLDTVNRCMDDLGEVFEKRPVAR